MQSKKVRQLRPGRPGKNIKVSIYVNQKEWRAFQRLCARVHRSASSAVMEVIRFQLLGNSASEKVA